MLKMLSKEKSCAWRTEIHLLIEDGIANDRNEAIALLRNNPGADIAQIEPFVVSGLTYCAEFVGVSSDVFTEERNLCPLGVLNAKQLVSVLVQMHQKWILENLTATNWVKAYFEGSLGIFRKASRVDFNNIKKYFIYIEEYLFDGENEVFVDDIKSEFIKFSKNDAGDADLDEIYNTVYSFRQELVPALLDLRENAKSDEHLRDQIDRFVFDTSVSSKMVEETFSIL